MVAIAILMIAILGPMDIASSGLRDSMFARDQATAYYLAQEGIEYVRYVRDYNFLQKSPGGWLDTLGSCVDSSTGGKDASINCTIDPVGFFSVNNGTPLTPTKCNITSSCPQLNLDTNGFYTQQAGTPSIFTRTIKIVPIGVDNKEVQIQSTVSFQSHSSATKTFTITENIRNLYQ